MTNCPLCGIDLDVDNVEPESHLSDRQSNRVGIAKKLANILVRLEQIEHNMEKLTRLSDR
jgi:hypothetical protein